MIWQMALFVCVILIIGSICGMVVGVARVVSDIVVDLIRRGK